MKNVSRPVVVTAGFALANIERLVSFLLNFIETLSFLLHFLFMVDLSYCWLAQESAYSHFGWFNSYGETYSV